MRDLTALRSLRADHPHKKPWGVDYRPDVDAVTVVVPGASSLTTTHYIMFSRLPLTPLVFYTFLGGLAVATLLYSFLIPLEGSAILGAVGIPLAAGVLGHLVLTPAFEARERLLLGIAKGTPLVVATHPDTEPARELLPLVEDAGYAFLAGDIPDRQFFTAVLHAVEALNEPRNRYKTATARLHLEEVTARP